MTSSFQPVQYQKYARPEGFDPIQTTNIAPNISREAQNVSRDMRTENLTEQQNFRTQILNQQIQQEGLDKLAQFSNTLTQALVQNQQRINKEEKLKGLNKVYLEGVPPEILDDFNRSRTELNENGLNMSRLANDAVEAGELPWAVAREMEGMSPHMKVGYAQGLLKQLGRQYATDANTELLQGTVGFTADEKMEALSNYRANWFAKTGLDQFNPAMLDADLFPEMRQIDNQITAQWIQQDVAQERANLQQAGDFLLKDGGYTQTNFEQAQEYYRSAGLTRQQARQRIFAQVSNDDELQDLGRLTSFDGKTPVSTKFPKDFETTQNRLLGEAVKNNRTVQQRRVLGATQYADQLFEGLEGRPATNDMLVDAITNSARRYQYVDPRLTNALKFTSDAERNKFWKEYLTKRAFSGEDITQLLKNESIPMDVRMDPQIRNLATQLQNAGSAGAGAKSAQEKELEAMILKPTESGILGIPGYVPNARIAADTALVMYRNRLADNGGDANEAFTFVKGIIDLGVNQNDMTKPGVGIFAYDNINGYSKITGDKSERFRQATAVIQQRRMIDRSLMKAREQNMPFDVAVQRLQLMRPEVLQDAQENSSSTYYKVPAMAVYIASKSGGKMSPWEVLRYQSLAVLNEDLKLPDYLTREENMPDWWKRTRYQFPTVNRGGRTTIIEAGVQVPGQPYVTPPLDPSVYQVGDKVGNDQPQQLPQQEVPSFDPSLVPKNYGVTIQEAATANGVDPALLAGLLDQESGFRNDAVSPAGAQGIAQFMPDTAKEFGVDTSDPVSSINGAARYLKYLMDYFEGNMQLALYAYNGGMGNVERYGGPIPGNQENEEYANRVMTKAAKYGFKPPYPPGLNRAVLRQLQSQ